MVEARSSKILANRLQRAAEHFGDTAEIGRAGRRYWPQVQKRLNGNYRGAPRCGIRHKSGGGLMQSLTEAFVIDEEK